MCTKLADRLIQCCYIWTETIFRYGGVAWYWPRLGRHQVFRLKKQLVRLLSAMDWQTLGSSGAERDTLPHWNHDISLASKLVMSSHLPSSIHGSTALTDHHSRTWSPSVRYQLVCRRKRWMIMPQVHRSHYRVPTTG